MSKAGNILQILFALYLVLGLHQGYIALLQEHDGLPCHIYPYKAELLPPQEQARLENGIPIQDREHLYDLLMNYLS